MSTLSSPSSPVTPLFRNTNKEGARWDAERDADTLFQNYSIEEIRKIEQEKRNSIQLKKEELRQMVGERYRDLIGAADSISDMMRCCEQASTSLSNSHQLCSTLLQTYKLKGTGPLQHGSGQGHELMCVGVNQMKLLVGIQGKIWSSIDVMDYKQAAIHYLNAKHIVSRLCLESVVVTHKKSVLAGIAIVLLQQWASIKHFQSTILDCCRQSLKSTNLECSTILQSLVTMTALDHISTRQTLNEFLIGRKAAIQQVFHPSQQVASVKSQMCQLMAIIKSCLLLTASLFCKTSLQEQSRIVVSLSDNMCTLQEAGLDVPATPTEIDQSAIHNSYREWLSMCTVDIQVGVSRLLHHVTSVRALSGIRDAVHNVLSQKCDDEMDWEDACNVVLGRKLCVWKELLQPLLFARAKVVLEVKFSDIENSFADLVSNFIDRYAGSDASSSFLWREEEETSECGNSSILGLKATGCSPHTYRFCLEFGNMLAAVADEVHYYATPGEKIVDKVPAIFDKFDDSNEIYQFVQQRTVQLINKFLNIVNELKPKKSSLDCSSVERLLLLGQLCQGLQQHCPLLNTLSQGCRPVKLKSRITSSGRPAMVGDLDKMNRQQANGVMELLHQMFTSIYRDWCEWTAGQLTERFSHCLLGDSDPLSCTVLNWEEVKISEETEGGNSVESIIRVPAQASCYVTSLLFVLCQQLASIRGHSLDKELLLHIGYNILKNVIDIYKKFLHILESISGQQLQNCALQILFDVKILSNLLPHTSTLATQEGTDADLTKATQDIVIQLENFIDPFDLDVFKPHLSRNLDRHHQRCSVMLGSISSLRSSSHIKLKGSSGVIGVTQEKHNVMPVAPSVAVFTSLPIITPSSNQETPLQSVQAPLSINEQMNFFCFPDQ